MLAFILYTKEIRKTAPILFPCVLCLYLEIVWQLLSTSITWIHCDEESTGWVQREFCPLKHEALQVSSHSLLDTGNLLGDHGQHLQLNSVELVKAGPGTGLCQTLKEFTHGFVVQTIRAVEHHTLYKEKDKKKLKISKDKNI